MGNALDFIKKHPILSSVFFVSVLILLYLATKSGGSSAGAGVSSSHSGPSEAAQLQMAQINAGLQAAQIQGNTQITLQSNDIAAKLQLAAIQSADHERTMDAQLTLATNQLQSQENMAAINADVTKSQIQTQAAIITDQINAAKETQLATTAAYSNRDNLQAQIALTNIQAELAASTTAAAVYRDITMKGIDAKSALDSRVLDLIRSGQLNKGGEGGSYQIQALGAVTNPAVAGTAAATYGAAASTNPLNHLLDFGTSIITGLF